MQTHRFPYKASTARVSSRLCPAKCRGSCPLRSGRRPAAPTSRTVEQHFDVTEGSQVDLLVDLVREEHSLTWICFSDVAKDVSDGRRRASQIQPSDLVEGFAPGRRNKKNKPMVRRQVAGREKRLVVAVLQVDCSIQSRDVALRQLVYLAVDLARQALRVREMSQDPVERITRAGKGINDGEMRCFRQSCGDTGDVLADAIT
jgi:hypothetical protein